MKFKLAVLCISLSAVSSVACAQSSVTLYGLIDVGVEYLNHVPTTGNNGANQFLMSSGNLYGSRWGIKGVEDLGGGLKAIFDLESGYTLNNGELAQGGREFGRKAYVGLSGNWGTVTLGRQYNLFYEQMTIYDPNNFSPSSAYTMDSDLAARADNSIKYTYERSGVMFQGFYSTGFDGTIVNGAQVPGATKVGREYGFSVNYLGAGPINAGIGYEQLQGTSIATQSASQRRLLIGANYVFGKTTVFLGYRWLGATNQVASLSSNLFWTGVRYQFSAPFSVSVGIYHSQFRNTHNGPSSGVILADYFLSKSTDLYAQISRVYNTAWSDVGVNGAGFNSTIGATQSSAIIGIKHTF